MPKAVAQSLLDQWVIFRRCPQWPLLRCFSSGHWTSASVEGFGLTEDSSLTHLHFYIPEEKVATFLDQNPGLVALIQKYPITSVSFLRESSDLEEGAYYYP